MKSELCHINLARGFGGGERQTELLVRELASRGVRQHIALRDGQPLTERVADVPGVTCITVRKPFLRHARRMRGFFLHAHDGKGAHFAHAAHTLAGCDYLVTRRVMGQPSASWLTRRIYKRAQVVVVISDAVGRVMKGYLPTLATASIPSVAANLPVDADSAAALRRGFGGEFVVLQVGTLVDRTKGQHDLIIAARELLQQDASWRFVFVGTGRDEIKLRGAAAGYDAIRFVGEVDNVGDYLAAGDALAFPSVNEGLGTTLLDAMNASLPIVASRVGGIPEVVDDGKTGILIPPRNPSALATALNRMRNEPKFAQRLAEAGKTKARCYTAHRMADQYVNLYKELGVGMPSFAASDVAMDTV